MLRWTWADIDGIHPVRTYQETDPIFSIVITCVQLKSRHPNRIDIRVLGPRGKLCHEFSRESKLFGSNSSGVIHRVVPLSSPPVAVILLVERGGIRQKLGVCGPC